MTVYILMLNDMRSPKFEVTEVVGWSDDLDRLQACIESERVAPYFDGRFQKAFRAGGPLEWFNPPSAESIKEYDHVKVIDGHVWTPTGFGPQHKIDWVEMT